MPARVIVTRPQRDADAWVAALAARGLQARALPLIEIAPAADLTAVHAAWRGLPDCLAAMFVSGNAVEQFFAARPAATDMLFSSGPAPGVATRAWATGPGTTRALLEAGVPPALIDAPGPDAPQFDSESLWQIVRRQAVPGGRVAIVRGADGTGKGAGRHWFGDQLKAAGCDPQFVVAYERRAPRLNDDLRALAMSAATDGSIWLFSSSEAIANLAAQLPRQPWAGARAIVTHPRIAQAARDAGFTVVCESRPELGDVVASIESAR